MSTGIMPVEESKRSLSQADIHGVLDLPAEYTNTAVQGRMGVQALERLKDDQFILTCSFHYLHVPITPSEPNDSMCKAGKMPVHQPIGDARDNSPYTTGKEIPPYNNPEKVKYMVANYNTFVTEIDGWVGKILTKLDDLGLRENTLVIFVSDH
ncbi:MAG: sulfatase-like hydrolase/transferase [Bacteroidales bacterium]|nr:sulfatase-like hydrolase/transferase [Bacteroidales bacterium]MCF8389166.1 sulfatase-like hydrolase/transferase [Bacteroidales bacterium]